MAAITIVAKNVTLGDINIEDMGFSLSPSGTPGSTRVLTDFYELFEISSSDMLIQYVSAGDVIINDGSEDLSVIDALYFLQEYEYFGDVVTPTDLTILQSDIENWVTTLVGQTSGAGPFMEQFHNLWFADADESSTTSTDWQDKLTVTCYTSACPSGYYRVGWYSEFYETNPGKSVSVRLYNVTDDEIVAEAESQQSGISAISVFTGFSYIWIEQEAHTFKIQWKRVGTAGSAVIRKTRLEFWKVD